MYSWTIYIGLQDHDIIIHCAYGSSKDISVYSTLGLKPDQIYIVGRPSKKQQGQFCGICNEATWRGIKQYCIHLGLVLTYQGIFRLRPVWPDWTKFGHFGQSLNVFGNFLYLI